MSNPKPREEGGKAPRKMPPKEYVGLPMPPDASDDQRVEACMAHHTAEVAARRHHRGFYLPETFDAERWRHGIVILVRLGEGWEGAALHRPRPKQWWEPGGGPVPPENHMTSREQARADPHGEFITVRWNLSQLARREMEEIENYWMPEVAVLPSMMWELGHAIKSRREHMSTFQCFVHDGGLETELQGEVYDW